MSPFAMRRKNKQYHTSVLSQFAAGKISPSYWCVHLLPLFSQLPSSLLSNLFELLAIVQTLLHNRPCSFRSYSCLLSDPVIHLLERSELNRVCASSVTAQRTSLKLFTRPPKT